MIAEVMPSTHPVPPGAEELHAQVKAELGVDVTALEALVQSLPLDTEADHEAACLFEQKLAESEATKRELTEKSKASAHEAWKDTCNTHNHIVGPYERARKLLKQRIAAWRDRKEELDRQRQLAASAEAQRVAEDQALSLAAALEDEGSGAEAAMLVEAFQPPAVVVPVGRPKSHGTVVQKRWSAEVVDEKAVLTFVLANYDAQKNLVSVSLPALNKLAQVHRESLGRVVPGTRGVSKAC